MTAHHQATAAPAPLQQHKQRPQRCVSACRRPGSAHLSTGWLLLQHGGLASTSIRQPLQTSVILWQLAVCAVPPCKHPKEGHHMSQSMATTAATLAAVCACPPVMSYVGCTTDCCQSLTSQLTSGSLVSGQRLMDMRMPAGGSVKACSKHNRTAACPWSSPRCLYCLVLLSTLAVPTFV